jgi:hypothetical protein
VRRAQKQIPSSKLPREQQKHVLRVVEDTLTAYEVRRAS